MLVFVHFTFRTARKEIFSRLFFGCCFILFCCCCCCCCFVLFCFACFFHLAALEGRNGEQSHTFYTWHKSPQWITSYSFEICTKSTNSSTYNFQYESACLKCVMLQRGWKHRFLRAACLANLSAVTEVNRYWPAPDDCSILFLLVAVVVAVFWALFAIFARSLLL